MTDKFPCAKFGKKTWMTENLNIEVPNSWTHPSDPDGNRFGRYYTWHAAIRAVPKGWHLPSDKEWDELIKFMGEYPCRKLRDGRFKVLPAAGFRSGDGSFHRMGSSTHFWSSSEYDATNAWGRYLGDGDKEVRRYDSNKTRGFSVRCIKN